MLKWKYTDEAVAGFLICLGLIQMALRPRKTYNLLVHKVGWHDMG